MEVICIVEPAAFEVRAAQFPAKATFETTNAKHATILVHAGFCPD
jgi:hypothetical protein